MAKELNMQAKELFQTMMSQGLIQRENENWVLTDHGKEAGGMVKTHPQYGTYIAWDESILSRLSTAAAEEDKLINATALSKHFQISKFRMNPILSELGMIQKSVKGWTVTKLGESLGGRQFEHAQTGIPSVSWNVSILTNKRLLETIQSVQGNSVVEVQAETPAEQKEEAKTVASPIGFREKFEAKHRTADGHYVRSRAEMLIDNWLYMSEIVHAYERKLPIEEEVYCDFYLPVGKVYIEYWGLENDERYRERKKVKLDIYEKYGFKLIELEDADIQNLDDILPKKLLKFGIQAY
ncbi:glycerol kinase [Paenibacillus sp. KR2-11]|uniref:glycerol kinase n=1 Tax=Paenibacillus sp. KR2-11 TaxID=3385500 RepID=UPI0038FCAF5D